jgi:hypothetical protein
MARHWIKALEHQFRIYMEEKMMTLTKKNHGDWPSWLLNDFSLVGSRAISSAKSWFTATSALLPQSNLLLRFKCIETTLGQGDTVHIIYTNPLFDRNLLHSFHTFCSLGALRLIRKYLSSSCVVFPGTETRSRIASAATICIVAGIQVVL